MTNRKKTSRPFRPLPLVTAHTPTGEEAQAGFTGEDIRRAVRGRGGAPDSRARRGAVFGQPAGRVA